MNGTKIKDYPNYTITEDGRVFSNTKKNQGKELKPQKVSQSKKKYLQVRLFNKEYKRGRLQYVHRLVWQTFMGDIPEGKEIDHIDGDTRNNHLSNLQCISRRGNMLKYNKKKYGPLVYDLLDEIKEYHQQGLTISQIAEKTGKSYVSIWRVMNNKRNKRVNGKYIYEDYDYGVV